MRSRLFPATDPVLLNLPSGVHLPLLCISRRDAMQNHSAFERLRGLRFHAARRSRQALRSAIASRNHGMSIHSDCHPRRNQLLGEATIKMRVPRSSKRLRGVTLTIHNGHLPRYAFLQSVTNYKVECAKSNSPIGSVSLKQ